MISLFQFERICRRLGEIANRRYTTIANALVPWILFLRDCARIERASVWEDRFPAIIFDQESAPPRYRAAINGILQLRFQALAAQQGYAKHLRRVSFLDEAGMDYGREHTTQSGSGHIAYQKRSITHGRSFGSGIVFSDQAYADLMEEVRQNTNSIFAFRTFGDIYDLSQRMNLTREECQRFPHFPNGRAFGLIPGMARAVELQFEHHELGDYPSAAEIDAIMNPVLHELRRDIKFTPEAILRPLNLADLLREEPENNNNAPESPEPAEPFNGTLLADQMAFLRDVSQFGESGIVERFRRLGFGASKGNRIKQELVDLGLLEVVEVRKSLVGAATKVLRLTALARTLPNL